MHMLLLQELFSVTDPHGAKRNKIVVFKKNTPFIYCIWKINSKLIDNAEDLDVVIPVYNLLEYSKNYRRITGSLWNYYRDEPSNPLSSDSESLKYKASITGSTYNLGAGDQGYDANKVGKMRRFHKMKSCCSTKIFKQFLENFRNAINKLWNRTDFNLVQKFCCSWYYSKSCGR